MKDIKDINITKFSKPLFLILLSSITPASAIPTKSSTLKIKYAVPYLFPKSLVLEICPIHAGARLKLEPDMNPYIDEKAYNPPNVLNAGAGNQITKNATVDNKLIRHIILKQPNLSAR